MASVNLLVTALVVGVEGASVVVVVAASGGVVVEEDGGVELGVAGKHPHSLKR